MTRALTFWILALLLLGVSMCPVSAEEQATAKAEKEKVESPARLKITGYGLIGNFELKRLLQSLDLQWKERETFDANFIEDSALIVLSTLQRDGYLKPTITVRAIDTNGVESTHQWSTTIDPPLQRPYHAKEVQFQLDPGPLYRYEQVGVEGSTELDEKEVRAFFIERGLLLPLKRTRVYTPDRLERSINNLSEALMRRGFENPQIVATNLIQNDQTGQVDLTIVINEGARSIVRSVRTETFGATTNSPITIENLVTNIPYSRVWQQDFSQLLRSSNYHEGFPDTTVEIDRTGAVEEMGTNFVELRARVRRGEKIQIGKVQFVGLEKTKPSVVHRRVQLAATGEPLDRIEAERGRHRLSRLGIFKTVDLRYDIVDAHTRDVFYTVQEGKRLNVSLLFGYGSYELVRAGIEVEQHNVFGRAHHQRLRAVQSFKASTVDYFYTMPEFVGERVDVFVNASYLRREEISFTREEFGGGTGARTFFDFIDSDFSTRYNYQILSADDVISTEGPTNATVGSIILEIKHDKRDSPLYPQRGYRAASSLELASEFLGGDVNFARWESLASFHQPLDQGRWLHFGLSHGVIFTQHASTEDLPFNKRFFPGGESSVRGFQFGEAAPRNSAGQIVGAETYTLGNLEFEQSLTDRWALITFVDAIGFARRVGSYPFDEYVVSAGLGVRWKTIIGPVRLEYGYNVLKRTADPAGTLHFSLGFPF